MTTPVGALSAGGLVLWRLRWSSDQQLCCSACHSGGQLVFTVRDTTKDQDIVADAYQEIAPLFERAEHLRKRLLACGWQDVDADAA